MSVAWTPRRLLRWSPPVGRVVRRDAVATDVTADDPVAAPTPHIDPDDPLLDWLRRNPEPVAVAALRLDTPAVRALADAGVTLVVPLVTQGELIGLLNLGGRLSGQEYSVDDRKLLENLAGQAAPALRVAQLMHDRETEVRRRERYEQELRVAQIIQQHFLPDRPPSPAGWRITAHYQPAREVGGDFYDFIDLPDGRIGVVVGDVTDKGVPAALVMASARSILRSSAQRLDEPGGVLAWVNDRLCPDMPPHMFVTCLYGVLDPVSGRFRFANAGHNLPCVQTDGGAVQPLATGMPLGLLPGSVYEEAEVVVEPGRGLLLYSDALPEAHSPAGEMYGFDRVATRFGRVTGDDDPVAAMLNDLRRFTGASWEQEDDITMVTLRRDGDGAAPSQWAPGGRAVLAFDAPSTVGVEREVASRVVAAAREEGLSPHRLERLATAVSEATMNAVEHGNAGRADAVVGVRVIVESQDLVVHVTDAGRGVDAAVAEPDLPAKLRGEQSPRGWGLFLMRSMVDDVRTLDEDGRHTVVLRMDLEGSDDA